MSVYLHIPLCVAKCPYCDFYSLPASKAGIDPAAYFDLVRSEIDLLQREDGALRSRRLITLYVGGGTPSLVTPSLYQSLWQSLRALFSVASPLEWTLEINPGTIAADNLADFLELGVNRLSIGVQSFRDETLERLGRPHGSAESRTLLDHLKKLSRRNLTWAIDLIFGAPGQTLSQWQADLEKTIAYRPHHCSVYGLTVHEGTPFARLNQEGRLDLPDEETQREMFLLSRRMLTAAGYEHYEISNYALPACRSRHNERYWTGGEYLGLGVAAHSFVGGVRWANPADLARYREHLEKEQLPRIIEPPPQGRSRLGEAVMLGLRRLEGIDVAVFRSRFGVDLTDAYGDEIGQLTATGLLELADGWLRLSEEGLLVADAIIAQFF